MPHPTPPPRPPLKPHPASCNDSLGALLVTHHLKQHPASRNDSLGGLLRPQRVVLTRWGVFLAPPPRYPVPQPPYTTQRVVLTRWGFFLPHHPGTPSHHVPTPPTSRFDLLGVFLAPPPPTTLLAPPPPLLVPALSHLVSTAFRNTQRVIRLVGWFFAPLLPSMTPNESI